MLKMVNDLQSDFQVQVLVDVCLWGKKNKLLPNDKL